MSPRIVLECCNRVAGSEYHASTGLVASKDDVRGGILNVRKPQPQSSTDGNDDEVAPVQEKLMCYERSAQLEKQRQNHQPSNVVLERPLDNRRMVDVDFYCLDCSSLLVSCFNTIRLCFVVGVSPGHTHFCSLDDVH